MACCYYQGNDEQICHSTASTGSTGSNGSTCLQGQSFLGRGQGRLLCPLDSSRSVWHLRRSRMAPSGECSQRSDFQCLLCFQSFLLLLPILAHVKQGGTCFPYSCFGKIIGPDNPTCYQLL